MTINSSFLKIVIYVSLVFSIIGCQGDTNQDFTNIQPEMSLSADSLIVEMNVKENNKKEMIVAVTGLVHEVNYVNNRTTILLEGKTKDESYIICDMNTNQTHNLKTVKKGDTVQVKGLLKGVLKDVIMLNCVIIKTK